jgi:hypothetical protein
LRGAFALINGNPANWKIHTLVLWNEWQGFVWMVGCNALKGHH